MEEWTKILRPNVWKEFFHSSSERCVKGAFSRPRAAGCSHLWRIFPSVMLVQSRALCVWAGLPSHTPGPPAGCAARPPRLSDGAGHGGHKGSVTFGTGSTSLPEPSVPSWGMLRLCPQFTLLYSELDWSYLSGTQGHLDRCMSKASNPKQAWSLELLEWDLQGIQGG